MLLTGENAFHFHRFFEVSLMAFYHDDYFFSMLFYSMVSMNWLEISPRFHVVNRWPQLSQVSQHTTRSFYVRRPPKYSSWSAFHKLSEFSCICSKYLKLLWLILVMKTSESYVLVCFLEMRRWNSRYRTLLIFDRISVDSYISTNEMLVELSGDNLPWVAIAVILVAQEAKEKNTLFFSFFFFPFY